MAQGGTVPFSLLVQREGVRLLQCLRDSSLAIISCVGWRGTGRWRIIEYATNAMETNLFDVLIWLHLPVSELKSHRKLQTRIAERLRIQSQTTDANEEIEIDVHLTVQIHEKLKDKNFLLILGSATWMISERIDLEHFEGIGVPNLRRGFTSSSNKHSKVILVGDWMNVEVDVSIKSSIDSSKASFFWDLICEEVALAVHSLSTKGYFSPSTVMHFLSFFSLSFDDNDYSFLRDKKWMIRHWIAEGLIEENMEKDEVLLEIMGALLTELEDRSILWWDKNRLRIDIEKENVLVWGNFIKWGMDGRETNSRVWITKDYAPKEREWEDIRSMSILFTESEGITLPTSPQCPILSTLFLRFGPQYFEFPLLFFNHMNNLRVLDLTEAPIVFLPPYLSALCNLRLLTLERCKQLASLPTSLRDLIRLEFLNLSGCHNLKVIPEKTFELMDKLRVLDLSATRIGSLPSSVSKLYNLQELLLHKCRALKSLPPDLSNLVNLKKLNLSSCDSLETGVSPQLLQNLALLEELNLFNCKKLKDISDASFHHMLPKLQSVVISYTRIPKRLSFRGCQSIETLDLCNLSSLEVLDVSDTKLKTLEPSIWRNLSLRRLDILPTRYSDVLFGELIGWGDDDDVGARIWVSNPNFFTSLKFSTWFFETPCFSKFYIRISPYEEEGQTPMTIDKFQSFLFEKRPVVYESIYHYHSDIQTQFLYHFTSRSNFSRQLEICGGNSSQGDIDELLARTNLITLLCNNFVERLSDLCDSWKLSDLKECRIGGCQMIKNIFSGEEPDLYILRSLEVIWISDLPRLTVVCDGVYGAKSFSLLKHIYVEHCPKLVTLFTSGVYFQSLETLEIRFCCMLENVFQQEVEGEGSMTNLRSLCLLHVPKLKSVCNGFLPRLEKVQVQRCPMLRKLPIQVYLIDHDINGSGYAASSSLPVVEIRGETKWWKNLQWNNKDDRNKRPARFRPWRRTPSPLLSHGIEW